MPRAPVYNPNQVAPVETTGARFRTPDFGPPSVAQGIAGLGGALNDYAVEEDRRNAEFDDTQARKLATNALTELQGITNEYTSLQGGNATAARKVIDERLAKAREAYVGQAANERQKRILGERLDPLFASTMGTIDKHYRSEEFTERLGAIATEAAQFADSAASTDDADAKAGFITEGRRTFQEGLRLKGITDPEAIAFETKKYTDGIHTATIDRLFAEPDPNIDFINDYVEAHSDEMTATGYAKAIGRLQGPLQDRSDYADFQRVVAGPIPPSEPGKPGTGFTRVATDVASRFGLSPVDVASVISYETGGTFSPTVMGGKGGQYMGLIQFGPSERAKYGITAQSSPEQWSKAVGDFLQDRGFKKGMGVLDLYSTINAGTPGRYNASDGNGTVRSHTAKLQEHRGNAEKWLAGGGVTEAPKAWDKDQAYNQIDEAAKREGWSFEKTNRVKAWADKQIARDEQLLGRERAAADEAAFTTVNKLGEGFTSISQLPSAVVSKLSPADVAKYDSIAKANAAPKSVPANGPTAFMLDAMEMADPNAFANMDLSQHFANLTPAERSSYMLKQQKVKDGLKGWTPYSGINGAVGRAKNFGGYKLDDGQSLAVRQIMQAEAERRFKANGGKPIPDSEFDEIFRVATRDVPTHKWYGATGSVKWYDQTVSTIGEGTRKKIVDAYKKTFGREPTDEETMTWYRRNFIPARAQ